MTPSDSKNQSVLLRIAPTTAHRRHFATQAITVSNPSTKTTIQYVVFITLFTHQQYRDVWTDIYNRSLLCIYHYCLVAIVAAIGCI
jgi:hypothetical protein